MWVYHYFLLQPGSMFPEVDPDPAKWYGSGIRIITLQSFKNSLVLQNILQPLFYEKFV